MTDLRGFAIVSHDSFRIVSGGRSSGKSALNKAFIDDSTPRIEDQELIDLAFDTVASINKRNNGYVPQKRKLSADVAKHTHKYQSSVISDEMRAVREEPLCDALGLVSGIQNHPPLPQAGPQFFNSLNQCQQLSADSRLMLGYGVTNPLPKINP